MALPATYNKEIYQGSDDTLALTWKQDGVAVDLTGYTARMQVRLSAKTSTVAEFSTALGTIALTSGGGVTVTISSAASALIPAGSYIYDIDLTTGTTTRTILRGALTVAAQVTT